MTPSIHRCIPAVFLASLVGSALPACKDGTDDPNEFAPTEEGAGAGGASGDGSAGAGSEAGGAAAGGAAGGGTSSAGAAGAAPVPRECPSDVVSITVPNPIVSLGVPVVGSAGVTHPEGLVDGLYHGSPTPSLGLPSVDEPAWVAFDIGVGPERLLLAWTDPGWSNYATTVAGAPGDYSIETSADSTDGEDGTWQTVVTVTANEVKARTHSFDFADQRWVRLVVTAPGTADTNVLLDEVEIHDVTAAGGDLPQDTWAFMGDSIVDMAFDQPTADWGLVTRITTAHPVFSPLVVNVGIGGDLSTDGVGDIEEWLELHPDLAFFAIQYGTNDSWGNKHLSSTRFEESMRGIVEAVLADGRTPILARIPYASDGAHETLSEFNAVVDALTVEYGLPCGPDLFAWFQSHPDELDDDGVHPTSRGQRSMNALWADVITGFYRD
jgi:acyl-CoA thioesterase-1